MKLCVFSFFPQLKVILKILGAPKLEIVTNSKTAARKYILDHTAHAIMLALRLSEESRSKACVFSFLRRVSPQVLFYEWLPDFSVWHVVQK